MKPSAGSLSHSTYGFLSLRVALGDELLSCSHAENTTTHKRCTNPHSSLLPTNYNYVISVTSRYRGLEVISPKLGEDVQSQDNKLKAASKRKQLFSSKYDEVEMR